MSDPPPFAARCLCGGVRFRVTESPVDAGYCHCTRCQGRTGSGSSAQARIDGRGFQITAGEDLVKCWRHPDGGFEKCFCGECGAHLFSRNPEDPSQMSIRMSAFEDDPGVPMTWRAFVANAAPWEPVPDDGLARYDGPAPRC